MRSNKLLNKTQSHSALDILAHKYENFHCRKQSTYLFFVPIAIPKVFNLNKCCSTQCVSNRYSIIIAKYFCSKCNGRTTKLIYKSPTVKDKEMPLAPRLRTHHLIQKQLSLSGQVYGSFHLKSCLQASVGPVNPLEVLPHRLNGEKS